MFNKILVAYDESTGIRASITDWHPSCQQSQRRAQGSISAGKATSMRWVHRCGCQKGRRCYACRRRLQPIPSDPCATGRSAGRCNPDDRTCWGGTKCGRSWNMYRETKAICLCWACTGTPALSATVESHHPRSCTAAEQSILGVH